MTETEQEQVSTHPVELRVLKRRKEPKGTEEETRSRFTFQIGYIRVCGVRKHPTVQKPSPVFTFTPLNAHYSTFLTPPLRLVRTDGGLMVRGGLLNHAPYQSRLAWGTLNVNSPQSSLVSRLSAKKRLSRSDSRSVLIATKAACSESRRGGCSQTAT